MSGVHKYLKFRALSLDRQGEREGMACLHLSPEKLRMTDRKWRLDITLTLCRDCARVLSIDLYRWQDGIETATLGPHQKPFISQGTPFPPDEEWSTATIAAP